MKKIRYILLTLLCVVGITSCQDELIEKTSSGRADVNKPVKVNLKFSVPDVDEVNLSRTNYDNSDLGDLHLFIFDGNTFLNDESVTSANIQRTNNASKNEYTINATLYEGEQTVYAVGNVITQTNYWQNPVSDLQTAAAKGREAFLNTLYNVRQDVVSGGFVTFPGNYRPLAGSGDITVADGSSSGIISMKREVARIKLNVNMNYTVTEKGERNGNKVTFTPQSYSVYNVASKGYVMETEDGNTQRTTITDGFYAVENMTNFNVSDGEVATIGDGFNIPENLQQPKQQGTTYAERDKWFEEGKEPGADDDAKEWTYAPQYATYIVIKGNYVETDASGNVIYSAAPSYTFHLGDWSNNEFGNFNVERNTIYTYTVSIHGVENMVVEVERKEENQPGAEGDVIELGEGSEIFNLDAHYEQVYVEYNLSDIADNIKNSSISSDEINNAIATNFMLSIHSPMNTKSGAEELVTPYTDNEADAMNGIDNEWIKFYSQNSRKTLSTYTSTKGDNNQYLLSPWDACKKMGEAVKNLINNENEDPSVTGLRTYLENGDYYACFTVFVDEYFYTEDLEGNKVSWEKFTRAEPRTLLIASDWDASPDGNTTYAKARTYISQASILTFYNTAAAQNTNALGIESYNEYGVINGFGESASSYDEKIKTDDNETNGRANMLLDIENLGWYAIPFMRIGYLSDNTETGHKWEKLIDSDKTKSAYYACLSRNRDLNRDGKIDDDEVRWYLPARSQYLRMGIGANSFNTEVQLYNGNKNDLGDKDEEGNIYPQNQLDKGTLYYSNTPYTKGDHQDAWELYWAVEVGAYGSNWDPKEQTTKYGEKAQIRCVRNLPSNQIVEQDSYGDKALAGPVYGELKELQSGNYIFYFGNRMANGINRTSPYNGPYREHNEMSEQNRLYEAFVIARDYLPENNYSASNAASYYDNPCRKYSEGDYISPGSETDDRWRTPNLNELTVMSTVANELGLKQNTMSSTTFSNSNVRGLFYYNGSMISAWDPNSGSGSIRCVRDATPEEIAEVRQTGN